MAAPRSSHSAVVAIELRAGNLHVPLAQLAHDFAIPLEAVDLPPCEAEIVMTVDGEVTRLPVLLHNGGRVDSRRIELSKLRTDCKLPPQS